MPTNDDVLLFDTSAALALVDADNVYHARAVATAKGRQRGLAGHAVFEFMSVLTRLPRPKRLDLADVLRLVRSEFPRNHFLPAEAMDALVDEFTRLGIAGGMVYDGLVGACARYHGLTLVSADRRAEETYRLLKVSYELL